MNNRLFRFLRFCAISILFISYFSVGYCTDENILISEAKDETSFIRKLHFVDFLTRHGARVIACQKFDRRYQDDYSMKEGLFKGYTVYGNYFINCDPDELKRIQDKLDQNGLDIYRVVNLSRASFSSPDEETIDQMKNFSTPTLSFPVGFPVYSMIYSMKSTDNLPPLIPSLCYLNSEKEAKTVIPSVDNIVSFVKYLEKNINHTDINELCDKYKKDHGIDYKTVYSLY